MVILWFPLIKEIMAGRISKGKQLIIALDRTQGLYGYNWIATFHECQDWVEELITSVRNKRAFYQRGLRAITLIQEAF